MTLRCIDIETTGIDPAQDAIVEIASVDLQRDATITNFQETLVRPAIAVPAAASAVHQSHRRRPGERPSTRGCDRSVQGRRCIRGAQLLFRAVIPRPSPWQYPMGLLRVWPDLAAHGNQALRYQFGHINPVGVECARLVPHRALSDAIVTAAIFFELVKQVSWPKLVRWSEEPAMLTYLRFGMHRDERFDAAPGEYLLWFAEGAHDLSDGVRFSARYWLDGRNGTQTG